MSAYSHPRLSVKELTEAEECMKWEYEYSLLDPKGPCTENLHPSKTVFTASLEQHSSLLKHLDDIGNFKSLSVMHFSYSGWILFGSFWISFLFWEADLKNNFSKESFKTTCACIASNKSFNVPWWP